MVGVQYRNSKLAPVFEVPYTVLRKTQGGSYVLQDEAGALMPRDYSPSEMKISNQDEVVSQDELYEVQVIIAHEGKQGNLQYLARWKGHGHEDDQWLTPDKFTDPGFIVEYWNQSGQDEAKADAATQTAHSRETVPHAVKTDLDQCPRRSQRRRT